MAKCYEDITFLEVPNECPSNKCYIYVLCDPDTEEIRYVGRTINKLSVRLNCHCCINGIRKNHNYWCKNWVVSLLHNNKRPLIKVIDIVDINNWQENEKYYINLYKGKNYNLTNFAEGGLGNTRSNAKKWSDIQKRNKKECLLKRNNSITLINLEEDIIIYNSNFLYISEYLNVPYKRVCNAYIKHNKILQSYYIIKLQNE